MAHPMTISVRGYTLARTLVCFIKNAMETSPESPMILVRSCAGKGQASKQNIRVDIEDHLQH